jgi:hypothetical protein
MVCGVDSKIRLYTIVIEMMVEYRMPCRLRQLYNTIIFYDDSRIRSYTTAMIQYNRIV